MISIILNLKSNRLTIKTLFSKLGSPKVVFITSRASSVPKIPGVTPITGRGPSFGEISTGEKTH